MQNPISQSQSSETSSQFAIKRPLLPSKEYETALLDDEISSTSLYDYTLMDAWWVDYYCIEFSKSVKTRVLGGNVLPSC